MGAKANPIAAWNTAPDAPAEPPAVLAVRLVQKVSRGQVGIRRLDVVRVLALDKHGDNDQQDLEHVVCVDHNRVFKIRPGGRIDKYANEVKQCTNALRGGRPCHAADGIPCSVTQANTNCHASVH